MTLFLLVEKEVAQRDLLWLCHLIFGINTWSCHLLFLAYCLGPLLCHYLQTWHFHDWFGQNGDISCWHNYFISGNNGLTIQNNSLPLCCYQQKWDYSFIQQSFSFWSIQCLVLLYVLYCLSILGISSWFSPTCQLKFLINVCHKLYI